MSTPSFDPAADPTPAESAPAAGSGASGYPPPQVWHPILFETAPDALILLDAEGRVLGANRRARPLFGAESGDVTGRAFAPPGEEGDWFRALWNVRRPGERVLGVWPDPEAEGGGSEVLVSWDIAPGYHVVIVPQVERVRAVDRVLENERRQLLQRLRLILDRMPAACMFHDADLRIDYWNRGAERIFGYTFEEVRGTFPLEKLVPPEQRDAVQGIVGRIRGGEDLPPMVTENVTRDGRRIFCEWHHEVLRDDAGKFAGYVSMVVDVTARHRAQEELVRQRERLLRVLDHVPVMIAFVDPDGRPMFVNETWTRVMGWRLEEVGTPKFWAEAYPDDAERERAMVRARESDGRWSEFRTRTRDGRLLDAAWANVRLSDGSIIGIGQDLSERKRHDEALRASQRLEVVGRLAGGVAHDFNNLLVVITGYTQLILSETKPDHPTHPWLEEVSRAAQRAATLTRQLLAFSRRQVLQPRLVDLNLVLADVEKMLRRLIGEDVRMVVTLGPGLGPVRVDPSQIEQVVMNLALNARDAMQDGGRLEIETSAVTLDADDAARIAGARPGPHVRLLVRDSGVGMDAETLSHAFEPFFTTKEVGRGTGLGLSTVLGIVQQSGGAIEAESAPGRGATFRVYFPRVVEGAAAPSAEDPARDTSGSEVVLLVEDEPVLRRLVRQMLSSGGYDVIDAAEAEEALALADSREGPIHLLVTDVIMPGANGRVLAETIRLKRPDLQVVFMSGYTADVIGEQGVLDEGTHFIAKPFTRDALLEKVRAVLDSATGAAR